MKAIVTTRDSSITFGNNPLETVVIDDANEQEVDGDFLFLYKKTPGLVFGASVLEDRAVFRTADVVKVVFEE